MIWLAALGGAGPISSTGSTIATPTIDGVSWKLYSGPNGATTVYSFVASSEVTSFSGDIKAFFTYLINSQGFSSSQYLTSIGAGTEPFTGKLTNSLSSLPSLIVIRIKCCFDHFSVQHHSQLGLTLTVRMKECSWKQLLVHTSLLPECTPAAPQCCPIVPHNVS